MYIHTTSSFLHVHIKLWLRNIIDLLNVGLSSAIKLAEEIAGFPQECMNIDRRSTYYSAFDAKSYEDAFEHELENGLPIFNKESVPGN